MRTPQDIRETEFQKAMSGYKMSDVELFLEEVADDFELLIQKRAEAEKRAADAANELRELKDSQSSIQNVLISAQKLADQTVEDAKKTADSIIAEAKAKAEQITTDAQANAAEQNSRTDISRAANEKEIERILSEAVVKSESMISAAHDSVARQQLLFDKLKMDIAEFKRQIVSRYKEQLESITKLPSEVPSDPTHAAEAVAFEFEKVPEPSTFVEAASAPEEPEEPEIDDDSAFTRVFETPEKAEEPAETEEPALEKLIPDAADNGGTKPEDETHSLANHPFFNDSELNFEEEEEPQHKGFFGRRK